MIFLDPNLNTFEWFGLSHVLWLLLIVMLIILMFVFKDNVGKRTDLWLRRVIAVSMVLMEWLFYAWSIDQGGFDLGLLPLGLCATSMYITAITLWTKSEKLFRFIYPWALSGALISLVIVNQSYQFPHFRYLHYFWNHSMFFLGNLYLLVVARFKITYKDILKSSGILLAYAAVIYPINFLLDTNHLFLRAIPHEAEPLYSFLGSFWVIGFVISIFLLFNIVYLPAKAYQKIRAT